MIKISEVKKLENLAKLNFSEQEVTDFTQKLNVILDMIYQLQKIDCNNIEPLRSVCEMTQRMNKDEAIEENISQQLFTNVPKQKSEFAKEVKCFIVPKVV